MPTPMVDEAGNVWEVDDAGNPVRVIAPASTGGRVFSLPPNPKEVRTEARQARSEARAESSAERAATAAERAAAAEERTAGSQNYNNVLKLRSDFDALPPVKEYRVAVASLGTGLRTQPDATGDNALIYAYAKAMDPGSVVRESEMGMAASGASVVEATVANLKKQLGVEGGGQLSPNVRERMRREMINKTSQLNKVYSAQRSRFIDDAKAFGIDPVRVVGEHDGKPFDDVVKSYVEKHKLGPQADADSGKPGVAFDARTSGQIDAMISAGASKEMVDEVLKRQNQPAVTPGEWSAIQNWRRDNPDKPYTGAKVGKTAFEESIIGQGLSGANEGLANVLGAPADLSAAVINAGLGGVDALAGTELPRVEQPLLGSRQIKDVLGSVGSILDPSADPSRQFARRVGESVGAAAVPLGGPGLTAGRYGGQLLAGLSGGVGAAGAQQAFPGNPLAEMAGEIAGGGMAAGGILGASRRNARKRIEEAVPTVPELKDQAGELYRAAESRGVVADPQMTQQLSENFRKALAAEGRISPTGRISEVYPKAREAVQLIDDYAGQTMNPTQIQNVRGVVADALSSPDRSERRLGGILTDVLDEWTAPLAPELSEARDVASRYLTAEQLGQARELAGARAGQFTGSGFENALRTEYRNLDRGAIRGNRHFNDDVGNAIETVSRGTPTSNFFRGLGRLAPTGPVSGMGSVVPAMAVGAMSDPFTGGLVGGTLAGAGIGGRAAATHMGIKAADQAELIARNGGALPAAAADPELLRVLRLYGLAELGNNLPDPITYPESP